MSLENPLLSLEERSALRLAALAEKAERDAELLRLHEFAADVLESADDAPNVCERALSHIALWEKRGLCHESYITVWWQILEMPSAEMRNSPMLRNDVTGVAFRQNSPLGFLRERMQCR